ncbi:MAG: sensor histidine kinase [Ignavibacteriaceae bacterium]
MRVIKQNTLNYEPFHKSLPNMTRSGVSGRTLKLVHYNHDAGKDANTNKYYTALQEILDFGEKIKELNDLQKIVEEFNLVLKYILSYQEADILIFDDQKKSLRGLYNKISLSSKRILGKPAVLETLDEIFRTHRFKSLADRPSVNGGANNAICLLLPAFTESKKKILLSIITTSWLASESPIEILLIQTALQILLSRNELLSKQEELIRAYENLQIYQSKLANDYKLSAIGELTTGIVDEILSPLQVILSYSEFLKKDNASADDKVVETILYQVKKVKGVINRLVQFASTDDIKSKVQSCDVNKLITKFYDVVISSLKNNNYECILDLDDKMPPMLSHPNILNQILTNLFSFLVNDGDKPGGFLIQTRYQNENIMLKFLSTDNLNDLKDDKIKSAKQLNLKIVKNLMDQQQGEIKIESDNNRGTIVTLLFPLKRKIN